MDIGFIIFMIVVIGLSWWAIAKVQAWMKQEFNVTQLSFKAQVSSWLVVVGGANVIAQLLIWFLQALLWLVALI